MMLFDVLYYGEADSPNRFVDIFSMNRGLSRSAAWDRLNSLKRLGMVEYSYIEEKGSMLRLTDAGFIVLRGIYAEE